MTDVNESDRTLLDVSDPVLGDLDADVKPDVFVSDECPLLFPDDPGPEDWLTNCIGTIEVAL